MAIVKLESVKLTNLSNIESESLIDPSDFSAINANEFSSNLIFLSTQILVKSLVIDELVNFLKIINLTSR